MTDDVLVSVVPNAFVMKHTPLIAAVLLLAQISTTWSQDKPGGGSAPEGATGETQTVSLNDLGFKRAVTVWHFIKPRLTITNKVPSLGGEPQPDGFGILGNAALVYELKGQAKRITGKVGIDDSVSGNFTHTAELLIYGDDKKLWESGPLRAGEKPVPFDVDLSGVKLLEVTTDYAGDQYQIAHISVADATITYSGFKPEPTFTRPKPRPADAFMPPKGPETPRITGARVFGVRPGSPFLFTVTASGRKPITLDVKGLPAGLKFDPKSGSITGKLNERGEFKVMLTAENELGKNERELKIVVGDKIALSPPMGWNSWLAYLHDVDQEKIEKTAELMVSLGLKDHGYLYVNIDDTWQGERTGKDMALQANQKFPDMKGLCDKIHSLGLKAGIYHTPWMASFGRYRGGTALTAEPDGPWSRDKAKFSVGPVSFLNQDARQFGEWGFDYVKWDWHPHEPKEIIAVGDALEQSGRDMVSSLSNRAIIDHAEVYKKHAQAWRTTNDCLGRWIFLNTICFGQDRWVEHVGPGNWPDLDLLVVGYCWKRPVTLTPDEQYLQMTMECLMGSPLLISSDLEKIDEFSLRLLTNDEVIEINQDPLGKAARRKLSRDGLEVYVKDLEDGSKAVGFFNRNREPMKETVALKDLGLEGKYKVRDLWKREDLPDVQGTISVSPNPHGVQFYRFVQTR